jgi:hypothetical protein
MGAFWRGILKTVEGPKKEEARRDGEDRIIKGV